MTSPESRARGACIWLTGRSGAGKTTLTQQLVPLLEAQGRVVSVFDTVPLLAKTPGEPNSEGKLLRKAFVASEVAKHGGIAVCVTVSASREVRARAREIVGQDAFVEVHLDVSHEVAESRRDGRGTPRPLRQRLRRSVREARNRRSGGEGSYQAPSSPEVRIDAASTTPADGAAAVVAHLRSAGIL